jgi:hypothetical protein
MKTPYKIDLKRYEEEIKRPGRFEGEQRYIPYFWDMFLEGLADEDTGRVLTFYVNDDEKETFPELMNRDTVRLLQREDGFIMEIKL